MNICQVTVLGSCFCMLFGGMSASAASYTRSVAGSWHETEGKIWKVGKEFSATLPGADDTVAIVSGANGAISVSSAPVTVGSISVGIWDASLSKKVILDIQTNFSATVTMSIGASEGHPGQGAVVVSGAVVSVPYMKMGTADTSAGELTVRGGGLFETVSGKLTMNAKSKITIEDGRVSVDDALVMNDGAQIEINGKSELWIYGTRNYAAPGSPLLKYVEQGWIAGDGKAGNVSVRFTGEKTVVTVSPTLQ